MSLNINGTTDITDVYFNNTAITKVVANGVTVWEKIINYTLTFNARTYNINNTTYYYNVTISNTNGDTLAEFTTQETHSLTIKANTHINIKVTTSNTSTAYHPQSMSINGTEYYLTNYRTDTSGYIDSHGKYIYARADSWEIPDITVTSNIEVSLSESFVRYRFYIIISVENINMFNSIDFQYGSSGNYGTVNDIDTYDILGWFEIRYYNLYIDLQDEYYVLIGDGRYEYTYEASDSLLTDDWTYIPNILTDGSYQLTISIKGRTYEYCNLVNESKSGGTYTIRIENPNPIGVTFSYNTLMANSGDFQNWTGLGNLENVSISQHGSTTVYISENWFADAAGGSFVKGSIRHITYGNRLNLDGDGSITLYYNQVSA